MDTCNYIMILYGRLGADNSNKVGSGSGSVGPSIRMLLYLIGFELLFAGQVTIWTQHPGSKDFMYGGSHGPCLPALWDLILRHVRPR